MAWKDLFGILCGGNFKDISFGGGQVNSTVGHQTVQASFLTICCLVYIKRQWLCDKDGQKSFWLQGINTVLTSESLSGHGHALVFHLLQHSVIHLAPPWWLFLQKLVDFPQRFCPEVNNTGSYALRLCVTLCQIILFLNFPLPLLEGA